MQHSFLQGQCGACSAWGARSWRLSTPVLAKIVGMITEVTCFVSRKFFRHGNRTEIPVTGIFRTVGWENARNAAIGGRFRPAELSGEELRNDCLNDSMKRRRDGLLPVPSSADRFPRFFVRRPTPLGFAFVPQLLALGQRQLHFHSAILEIQPCRN